MDPQEQMMAALNRHINTTNDILNRLVDYAANPPAPRPAHTPLFQPLPAFATTSHSPKKYIALPEPFDGNPKNWRVFKGQCHTYLTANADAFNTESDRKWFILSHMNKGTAAGIVEWVKSDMRSNFDGKSYESFLDVLDGLLADPTEKQTALSKLDALKQGSKPIVQFLSEFDVLASTAGYQTPTHDDFLCHMLRMKVNTGISDRLFDRGFTTGSYSALKTAIISIAAANEMKATERRIQGWTPRYSSNVPRTTPVTATQTGTGITFGGQGQPMDIGQAKAQGLCFNCHQKGHMSRNCPAKRKAMVRQIWAEMSDGDKKEMASEFVTVSDKAPVESDFSQPQQ